MTTAPCFIKLAVLGTGAVGKSALTIMFINNHFVEVYDPTIEDAYRKQIQIDSNPYLLDIMDTAGQEEYSAMRDQYMRHGDGFLLIYSIDNRTSFQELGELRSQVLMCKDKLKVPMVLVGNKCDLEEHRQVTTQEGKDLASQWGIPFFETSALMRHNVDETFHQVVREVAAEFPEQEKKKKKKKIGSNPFSGLEKKLSDCRIV